MPRLAVVLVVTVFFMGWNTPHVMTYRGGDKLVARQYYLADCLKGRGFKYSPEPQPAPEPDDSSQDDYAVMRADRVKYGYHAFAGLAHPEDPDSGGEASTVPSVNQDYMAALSRTQQQAYNTARERCYAQSIKEIWHKDVSDPMDHYLRYQKAVAATQARELDGDPNLVKLARTYADCMISKGYPISSARPSEITTVERARFHQIMNGLAGESPKARPGIVYVPVLPPAEALPYLEKEIRSALDDLECGRAFRLVYNPKANAIIHRVDEEWGQPAG